MRKYIYQALATLFMGIYLAVVSYYGAGFEENIAADKGEVFVRSVLIVETETGSEKKLRAERDGEAIIACWEILQELPQDTMSCDEKYMITFFFNDGTGIPYSVSKEDVSRAEFFESFFDNMLKPL